MSWSAHWGEALKRERWQGVRWRVGNPALLAARPASVRILRVKFRGCVFTPRSPFWWFMCWVRCPSFRCCSSTYLPWPNVASRVISVHSWMTKLVDAQSKAKGEREGAVQPQKEEDWRPFWCFGDSFILYNVHGYTVIWGRPPSSEVSLRTSVFFFTSWSLPNIC